MNSAIELDFWLRLLGILALEISMVVALAFAAQALTQSAFWRRAIWQSCFVCLLLLVASEFSGAGRGFAIWLAAKPVVQPKVSVRILPADDSFVSAPIEAETSRSMEFSEKAAPVNRSVWWPGILWLVGLALISARILFARILFVTLRWRKGEITDATLRNRVSELALHLGIRRKIHVLESPGFSSPMTFGIAQPCIALPKNFSENFSSAEQDAMLTHELAHVAARDPFWYLLADMASALLWWHPLVWLARRRLHSASELAADEAAAILENGPCTLAECLVNLGQRMTQPRSFGWLGVGGNGFRSHLGQRVERLLNLKPAEKNKLRGWPLFLAKTAFTILFGGLIVFTSGWIQNGKAPHDKDFTSAVQKSWNQSFVSKTLAALAAERKEPLAKNEIQATAKATKFSHHDELAFETLIYNDFSPEQLEEIQTIFDRRFAHSSSRLGDVQVMSSKDLQNILFALSKFKDRMAMPWNCGQFIAPFDMVGTKSSGVPIIYQGSPTNRENSCNYLTENNNGLHVVTGAEMSYQTGHEWSFSVTPHMRGDATEINLEWEDNGNKATEQFVMPAAGGAIARRLFSNDPSRNQLVVFSSRRLPRVNEKANDQEIHEESIKKAKVMEVYRVDFSPKTVEANPLYTRTFKLAPEKFLAKLNVALPDHATGILAVEEQNSSNTRLHTDVSTRSSRNINEAVREFFSGVGVNFSNKPPVAPSQNQNAVFFNDRSGLLLVRATADDFEKILPAIEPFGADPAQVLIDAKFVEIGEAGMKKLGLNWFAQNATASLTNQIALEVFLSGTNVTKANINAAELSGEPLSAMAGIFTAAQYEVVLKALEKAGGTDILAAPKVTTLSDRQAVISVQNARTIVNGPGLPPSANTNILSTNGLWVENIFTGPLLDVLPTVSVDGFAIQMTLKGTVSDFLGYYDAVHKKFEEIPSSTSSSPAPHVRLRQVKSDVKVWDGQTVVLALEDKSQMAPSRKNLFLFVTASIIDAIGNRVHTDEDLRSINNPIPRQP